MKHVSKNLSKNTNKQKLIDLSEARFKKKMSTGRTNLDKLSVISKRITKTRFRGFFNFLILLQLHKHVSILKIGLLVFPLIGISLFSNFIIASIVTGMNAVLCSLIYIWLERLLFAKKSKFFWVNNAIEKKKKILGILIMFTMNILSTYIAIKYNVAISQILLSDT